MERLTISGAILVFMVAGATAGDPARNTITKTFRTNNGMFGVASITGGASRNGVASIAGVTSQNGVASIAGVTSRNGRVSSVSGVKFYPAPTSQDMPFFFANVKSGEKLPEPISFSNEEDGRITSGSIKIGPGSVSVSSSARSAYPAGSSSSAKFMKPSVGSNEAFDDMFFPYPLTTFSSRSFDPWFPNDWFKQPPQPRFDAMRQGWSYPSFSPFNYW